MFVGINTIYNFQESEIQREAYLSNLEQAYEQEIAPCLSVSAPDDSGQTTEEVDRECADDVNENGQYGPRIQRWGGKDMLR